MEVGCGVLPVAPRESAGVGPVGCGVPAVIVLGDGAVSSGVVVHVTCRVGSCADV